ncbi:spermidine/spermine N(1)-acetyltransferase [soil metagenome]
MNNIVTIRTATKDDAVLISVLASATFYEAYFEQDESHNLSNYISGSFAVDCIRAEITDADSAFFLIFLAGKAVGYAKLIADSLTDCVQRSKAIELKRFYLVERVWQTGVGRALLEHCIDEAKSREFDVIWLGVWEENLRAQRFYAKCGFTQVGTVTFPYGDVDGTNLVLEKKL